MFFIYKLFSYDLSRCKNNNCLMKMYVLKVWFLIPYDLIGKRVFNGFFEQNKLTSFPYSTEALLTSNTCLFGCDAKTP